MQIRRMLLGNPSRPPQPLAGARTLDRRFRDRREAGRTLVRLLRDRRDLDSPVVLALPRGGGPVAEEVARALDAPLDVLVVRKVGLPGQPELAMGAVASGGVRVWNREVVEGASVPDEALEAAVEKELREVERRERLYRGEREMVDVKGRTVIVVDDGLATGSTMVAAVRALRKHRPVAVVVAVPVAPPETCGRLEQEADTVICARTPEPFYAVGLWYDSFPQLTDEDVRRLLDAHRSQRPPPDSAAE